ncbi:alpha/beta hydrolase family protein [Phyllobacterium endophyticum]|uniref:alpha/beta hydrolase family protein n=1 Tax=Phyllobacterium endophyticum TaxID=1149773 RepID=UPI0031BB162B
MKSYHSSRLSAFLEAGYAIVATDYHGLGTEGDHQYCNGVAHGRDVVYSVKAAKEAGLGIAEKWVVAGHSQGSITAWSVAAEQYLSPDASYRGAIAVTGGMQKDKVVGMYSTTDDPFNSSMIMMVALGVAARFPQFELSRMLLPAGLRHIDELKNRAGLYYAAALYGDVLARDILIPGWETLPEVERWFREFVPGERPVTGPILVTASNDDSVVDAEGIEASVLRAQAAGADITFTRYDGFDHAEVLHKTFPNLISWIKSRFA